MGTKEYKQEQVLRMSTKTEEIMVQTNKPAMALVTHLKMTGKTVNYDQEHKIQRLEGRCWKLIAWTQRTTESWICTWRQKPFAEFKLDCSVL